MDLIRKGSIKQKLMKISMLTTCVALLLTSVLLIANEVIVFHQSLIERLEVMAKTIGTNSTAALIFNDQETAEEILNTLKSAQNITCAVLYSRNGDVFAKYIRDGLAGDCRHHPVDPGGYHIGIDHLDILQRINLDNESIGSLYIRSDIKELYYRIQWHVIAVIIFMTFSIAIAFMLMSRLQKIITKPLSDMADVMKTISGKKNYSERVAIQSQDEVGIFGEEFNEMLSQIQVRDAELELHREHLQDLVTQRTEELARTNINLQQELADRKRAEEALRETQRRLTDIIEFLPDATMVIDKDGKVIAWNRAIESMTGLKAEEMLGKGNYEYALPFYGERKSILIDLALHPDPEKEKAYTSIQRTGEIIFGEAYTTALAPGDVHLSATASVLRNSRGEIIAAIECIRNNTDRKKMEERLQRAEKMESLGVLAGGVAHDLNNVIGVLVGYSELLLRELPEESRAGKYAESILQGGERAAAIIQDLLTMARRGVSVSETVNLNRIVSNFFKAPEFELVKSHHPHVLFRSQLETDLFNIKGSPVHLFKTIMNLLSNAAESIRGAGEVSITTETRYVDVPIPGYENTREGEYVVLTVSDTGSGISPADLGRIFEPFYTKKVMGRSGTGLGLAVVWGTVKDHGGYIDVRSEEYKGSAFILYFPVTREALSKADQALSPDSYHGRGESILIVDDVEAQRLLAAAILENLNYRAATAASGEDAVEYLRANKADLVVLDMIMDPGIDGLETYRRILEIRPQQKAIIVSGFAKTDLVKTAQELGAGEYVKKPYVIEKLGMAVRRELDRE